MRKSPPLAFWQSQRKASSRSVPPPIMAVPGVGLVWMSAGLPMRKYWYEAAWAVVANSRSRMWRKRMGAGTLYISARVVVKTRLGLRRFPFATDDWLARFVIPSKASEPYPHRGPVVAIGVPRFAPAQS